MTNPIIDFEPYSRRKRSESDFDLVVGTYTEHWDDLRFPAITNEAQSISDILDIKISRKPEDSRDNTSGDVLMKEFDIHFTVDSFGSRQEFLK